MPIAIHSLSSLEAFREYWRRTDAARHEQSSFCAKLCEPYKSQRQQFTVNGFSYPAGRTVDYLVKWNKDNASTPNWRETTFCPITGLNARQRACVHLIDCFGNFYPDSDLYISEQVTPLFTYLSRNFSNLVGSEYKGAGTNPGAISADGIRHEDLTNLSISTGTLDGFFCFECLEHIPDYPKAIQEAARVIRPGGKLFLTAPFCAGQQQHTFRAQLRADGTIVHNLPPEYHGDPISSSGCLCYTQFGWQLLDEIRGAGFLYAAVITISSLEFGYHGDGLLTIFAIR